MARELETSAILLRAVDFGEADRIVALLTKERGKVVAFARGVRKSTRRFRGGLGAFVELEVTLRDRGADKMPVLAESEAIASHAQIGSHLPTMAAGTYATELLDSSLQDDQGAELFPSAVRLFRWLAAANHPNGRLEAGLHRFQLLLLSELGFLPDLSQCQRTGDELDDARGARWVPGVGIITPNARFAFETAAELPPGALGYLRGLAAGRFPNDEDDARRRAVRKALYATWCHVLDREPKSYRFLATTLD